LIREEGKKIDENEGIAKFFGLNLHFCHQPATESSFRSVEYRDWLRRSLLPFG
jgi:hypothetical protein